MTSVLRFLVVLLPWFLRRHVLRAFYGFKIHPTARIGCSWIFPRLLIMEEGARIGHFNVAIHLDRVEVGAHTSIERGNWITGYPTSDRRHFAHLSEREPVLCIGPHSAVTKRHHFDCTDRVEIGAFTTIAGYHSQFITHGIDPISNRQDCAPIRIGDHCLLGTNVVVLGGAMLPPRSVLGAKALLNKAHADSERLYAGVPAHPLKTLPADAKYFHRTSGFVD